MESRSGTARCLTSYEGAGGFQNFLANVLPEVPSAASTVIDRRRMSRSPSPRAVGGGDLKGGKGKFTEARAKCAWASCSSSV